MNKFFSAALLLPAVVFGQAVPKAPQIPPKVFSEKTVILTDPARENPVLVLYGNKRTFVKDAKSVTDTLGKSRYRILTNADSIKRYSDSKFVRQVILISNP